jgi:hypothetical protein
MLRGQQGQGQILLQRPATVNKSTLVQRQKPGQKHRGTAHVQEQTQDEDTMMAESKSQSLYYY